MILIVCTLHTYIDGRRQMYDPYHKSAQYVGPVVRAIRLIQKRYHERHAERLTQANIIEAKRSIEKIERENQRDSFRTNGTETKNTAAYEGKEMWKECRSQRKQIEYDYALKEDLKKDGHRETTAKAKITTLNGKETAMCIEAPKAQGGLGSQEMWAQEDAETQTQIGIERRNEVGGSLKGGQPQNTRHAHHQRLKDTLTRACAAAHAAVLELATLTTHRLRKKTARLDDIKDDPVSLAHMRLNRKEVRGDKKPACSDLAGQVPCEPQQVNQPKNTLQQAVNHAHPQGGLGNQETWDREDAKTQEQDSFEKRKKSEDAF
jgi:hypothetical protein